MYQILKRIGISLHGFRVSLTRRSCGLALLKKRVRREAGVVVSKTFARALHRRFGAAEPFKKLRIFVRHRGACGSRYGLAGHGWPSQRAKDSCSDGIAHTANLRGGRRLSR